MGCGDGKVMDKIRASSSSICVIVIGGKTQMKKMFIFLASMVFFNQRFLSGIYFKFTRENVFCFLTYM